MEIEEEIKLIKVSEAIKYKKNPFVEDEVFKIQKGQKTIIAGSTNKILVDRDTGETEGIGILHKFKEVDKTAFVKLYISEISNLFELTKTGIRLFGYILQCLRINDDEIYLNITKAMEYCNYSSKKTIYKGLGELMSNKIIAMSDEPNIWYINPSFVFNGDRIAFIKQYKIKANKKDDGIQLKLNENSENKP